MAKKVTFSKEDEEFLVRMAHSEFQSSIWR